MRALVTGAAGFVGRHIVAELVERGWTVTPVDLIHGEDCLDLFRTDTTRYDLAVHCAAVVGGRACIDGSPLSVGTNLALDAWYFRWLERSRTPRAVYFSSSAVYPVALQTASIHRVSTWHQVAPVRALTSGRRLVEDDVDFSLMGRPDQTYGFGKLAGEVLARYAEETGTRVTIARPFSGYSEMQPLDYPFPSFVDRAQRHADPFDIWGDGEQVRDWVHISDVVAGTLAAVEQDVQGPVNLCTGRATSFNELAKLVTEAAGYSPGFRHLTAKPSGVQYRVGDPAKLHTLYTPRVSLEEGIRRALAG
ncbi:NAD-dependent epimerase/dehydratase family protein [Kutzneria albida]|uniref:NAD-dependent epimerase/dehydratase domain-containing protein n=1 Tax=Kutzneria albida DSM 43870 TaxID=1449976 RepID=W5WB29_9PSEU|nr:NAD-dependent epimerase/dehydratase family protein [Kutzneria albida]AHH98353.1 hypothetical protein KALB_4991 [Kutzneria albida DSM 43870]